MKEGEVRRGREEDASLSISVFGQPSIQGLALFELATREPFIVFWSIADPADEVLPPTATSALIDDLVDDTLVKARLCEC